MGILEVVPSHSVFNDHCVYDSQGFKLSIFRTNEAARVLDFNEGSIYLYVQSGSLSISKPGATLSLGAGYYLSQNAPVTVTLDKETCVVLISMNCEFKPLETIGGPIESGGRLKYIDGCSDTLLLPPAILGEPCLNLLHFPVGTRQTMHNHPSFRFGIVARGQGMSVCVDTQTELNTGDVFFIPPFLDHKFDTYNSSMDIIAFHPDSDWGPTNDVHPMINRTWVNGKKI